MTDAECLAELQALYRDLEDPDWRAAVAHAADRLRDLCYMIESRRRERERP